jgi:hypothetical protein
MGRKNQCLNLNSVCPETVMEKYIYEALYYYKDEGGEEGYDLYNVQLLEHFDNKRIQILKKIIENEDRYISYQAMLILISWGIKEGFNKFNDFITEKWYEKLEFEPHRIYDEDNVFDVISRAFNIAYMNGAAEIFVIENMKIILSFYGTNFFEGNLKRVLLKRDGISINLTTEIKAAIEAALKNNRYYQASQLLSLINKYDKSYVSNVIPEFEKHSQIDNRINFNLEELLVK